MAARDFRRVQTTLTRWGQTTEAARCSVSTTNSQGEKTAQELRTQTRSLHTASWVALTSKPSSMWTQFTASPVYSTHRSDTASARRYKFIADQPERIRLRITMAMTLPKVPKAKVTGGETLHIHLLAWYKGKESRESSKDASVVS